MPIEEGFESGAGTPVVETAPGVGGLPPPPPGLPLGGPYVAPGLRGRERWEAVKRSQPGAFAGPAAYQTWLRSLPNDPTDPEYQAELDQAKKFFLIDNPFTKAREGSNYQGMSFEDAVKQFNEFAASKATEPRQADTGAPGPTMQSAGGPQRPPEPGIPSTSTGEEEIRREKDWRKAVAVAEQPVFRGRSVGTDEIYQPLGPKDPYLDGFLSENGIVLPGNDRNKALRTGQYVYMGSETSTSLGTPTTRDVYMYVEDAQAAGVKVDSAILSKYQTELGLEVTGRMDGYLIQQWDWAVQMAQRSAMAGDKMSVREWFDIRVQAAIAQKKASAAGGGGGAQDLEEFDYYRGMMQILGDISGVEG